MCGKNINANITPVECNFPGCPSLSHAWPKCTRISRYKTKANWICDDHNTNINAPQSPAAEEDTGLKIKKYCSQKGCGIICKESDGEFQCINCLRYFHQRCTLLSRAVREGIKIGQEEWTCNKCVDEINAVPPSIPVFVEDSIESSGSPCLLYTSPSPRDVSLSRMPSSA